MKISKSMLAAGAVTTVAVASLAGIGTASAHQGNNGNGDSIVDRLSTTFGLNREEVQTVFDEQKSERQEMRRENREKNLQGLVDSGVISEDQKNALDAKNEERKAAMKELKSQDLTKEEMRTQMNELRSEFKAWASEQGINLDNIHPEGHEKGDRMNKRINSNQQ